MRLKDFIEYYGARLQDRRFRYDMVEIAEEEIADARSSGICMGSIQRENEIKSKLLSALLKEDV